MSKAPKATLVTTGIFAIVLGGLGIWYNVTTFFVDYSDLVDQKVPYFYHPFYLMSGICFLCYVGLIASGIQFVRGAVGAVGLFISILVFESMYLIALGVAWAALTSHLSMGLVLARRRVWRTEDSCISSCPTSYVGVGCRVLGKA